jgi:hypothetical protein
MNKNIQNIKENFDIKYLIDPTAGIKELLWIWFIFLVKVCIFGYIIYLCYKHSSYIYSDSLSIEALYFFMIGSIVLYIVSMLYFMYRCYQNGVPFSEMNYKGYALSSLLAPSLIFSYIIFRIIVSFIKVTPLIGFILYAFTTMSILIILLTGFVYNLSFEIAYDLTKCSKN